MHRPQNNNNINPVTIKCPQKKHQISPQTKRCLSVLWKPVVEKLEQLTKACSGTLKEYVLLTLFLVRLAQTKLKILRIFVLVRTNTSKIYSERARLGRDVIRSLGDSINWFLVLLNFKEKKADCFEDCEQFPISPRARARAHEFRSLYFLKKIRRGLVVV